MRVLVVCCEWLVVLWSCACGGLACGRICFYTLIILRSCTQRCLGFFMVCMCLKCWHRWAMIRQGFLSVLVALRCTCCHRDYHATVLPLSWGIVDSASSVLRVSPPLGSRFVHHSRCRPRALMLLMMCSIRIYMHARCVRLLVASVSICSTPGRCLLAIVALNHFLPLGGIIRILGPSANLCAQFADLITVALLPIENTCEDQLRGTLVFFEGCWRCWCCPVSRLI